jgi:hypothetical protein
LEEPWIEIIISLTFVTECLLCQSDRFKEIIDDTAVALRHFGKWIRMSDVVTRPLALVVFW